MRLALGRRRNGESRIMFPWEKRRARLAWITRRHARAAALVVLALLLVWALAGVESRRRATFATRATIGNVMRAVEAYRADHDGHCPATIAELVTPGEGAEPYLAHTPRDGWGRTLRMRCPGRKHPRSADVVSGGPSGTFEDLDQIE
jgi:hypothetical protein